MKKILFLLLLVLGNLSFSEYIKEGTYNGLREKKIFIKIFQRIIILFLKFLTARGKKLL